MGAWLGCLVGQEHCFILGNRLLRSHSQTLIAETVSTKAQEQECPLNLGLQARLLLGLTADFTQLPALLWALWTLWGPWSMMAVWQSPSQCRWIGELALTWVTGPLDHPANELEKHIASKIQRPTQHCTFFLVVGGKGQHHACHFQGAITKCSRKLNPSVPAWIPHWKWKFLLFLWNLCPTLWYTFKVPPCYSLFSKSYQSDPVDQHEVLWNRKIKISVN